MKNAPKILLGQCLTMLLSVSLAQTLSYFCSADQSFWIPLTTFCVSLYISTPLTALRRTVHRILGSIYGVVLSGVVILLWPGLYQSLFFLTVFAGLTLWSRAFVSLYYMFVAFMTASVIMLLSILMQNTALTPDYLITERLLFTLTGALISLLCSLLLMPPLENWDMLKTYRHYLTRFLLDYRLVMRTSSDQSAISLSILLDELHQSTNTYNEKLPIWRWHLFFDHFIYRSLTRYLHRIYNMRVLVGILHPGLQSFFLNPNINTNRINHDSLRIKVKELLANNIEATNTIIRRLESLKREEAGMALQKLKDFNLELDMIVKTNNISELKTVTIVFHELEYELEHLISGPVQHYLWQKKNTG